MENRIEVLRKYIDETIQSMNDINYWHKRAYTHLYGVSHFWAMIALKRKQNAELATMAGLLHDFYTYKMMDQENHAEKGAILAKETLDFLRITDDIETELICDAISKHTDKKNTHSAFAEILKDADTMQPYLYNITSLELNEARNERIKKLKDEFCLH